MHETSPPRFYRTVSALILGHLVLLITVMSASYGRSETTGWLLSKCAVYTQLLNFDLNLNFARVHLTHATQVDVDHRVELLPEGADPSDSASWIVIRAKSSRSGERYRRYLRWSRSIALLVDAGDHAGAAALCRDAASHFLHAEKITPSQIRVRRHLLQDWGALMEGTAAEKDPASELYFRTTYIANCVVHDGGKVDIVRLEAPNQVAAPAGTSE